MNRSFTEYYRRIDSGALSRWLGPAVVLTVGMALVGCGVEQRNVTSIETPFHGKGSAVDWAEWITTVLAVAIPIFIVGSHVLNRSMVFLANILRFAGLAALPLGMWIIGSYATFEGAKSVEFCHSCHEPMDMYVADMMDPSSDNLAAVHYKNRFMQDDNCFTCHADYGVFGGLEAKMTGLYHLYFWLTKSPTGTGEAQIHSYHPYSNDWCLHCHAGSQKFLEADDGTHRDLGDALLSTDPKTGAPQTSCLDCHVPPHPTLEEWKAKKKGAT
jgi:cytochrome c-type protein NapC